MPDTYEPQVGDYVQIADSQRFGIIEDIEPEGWYWVRLNTNRMYRATKFELKRVAGL